MPSERSKERRATNSANDVTDQQLLETCWIGKKTGNIFKVLKIRVEDGVRMVEYQKADGKTFENDVDRFLSILRPVNQDEMWTQLIKTTLEATESAETGETSDVGIVIEPDELDDLNRLILYPQTIRSIEIGLFKIQQAGALEEHWSLSKIDRNAGRSILNLYGEPGTGKTSSARGIAHKLGKKLYQVDYAQVISKYPGDTAKHIKMAFDTARSKDYVLFLDEADSIVSRRVDLTEDGQSCSTSINQNRNVLMQELDRFQGVILMSTNHFRNFDPAMLRRVAQHVEFPLPNVQMLAEIYKKHMPNKDDASVCALTNSDWETVANASHGFSGGDVLNAVLNAITSCSLTENRQSWKLTLQELLQEAQAISRAKSAHSFRPATSRMVE